MARIAFVVCNHTSALISALTFSKALIADGHQVTIMGNDNSCQQAAKAGLKAVTYGGFAESSAPTGLRVACHDRFTHWLPPSPTYLEEQNRVCDILTGLQQQESYDLALVDTMISYPFILGSLRVGVPVARFTPNFGGIKSAKYPAVSTPLKPASNQVLRSIQCHASWLHRGICVFLPMLASCWTSLRSPKNYHRHWHEEIRTYGIRLRLFEYGITAANVPELIAAPAALEFPSLLGAQSWRTYIGACVDPCRALASSVDWKWAKERPLIYCAMGTFSKRYSHAKQVFETVISYALMQSDYNFLIQCGEVDLELGTLPEHICVERFVPQIEALRHAAVMISHGGLGSVREASFFGVPMLIVPGWNDQYGNAARIEFHGTGVKVRPKHLTVHSLGEQLSMLQTDPTILRNLGRMRDAFREQASCQPGLRAVNKIIDQFKQHENKSQTSVL